MSPLKYLILLLFFASTNLYADQLLNCDGCSDAQKRNLVFNQNLTQNQTENYYVIDFANQTIDRYTLYFEFEIGYFKEVFTASVPQNVQNAANDYFAAMNNMRANPDDAIAKRILSEILGGGVSLNSTKTSIKFSPIERVLSTDPTECSSSSELYDLLSKPHVRKEWYDRLTNESPVQFLITDAWNDFVASTNAAISASVVNARLFSIVTPIEFADGGEVQVTRRPMTSTFNIVKGTALDCHGNLIPTTLDELPDFYSFASADEYDDFLSYTTDAWNGSVEFLNPEFRCRNAPIQTRCRRVDGQRFECVAIVPPCQF